MRVIYMGTNTPDLRRDGSNEAESVSSTDLYTDTCGLTGRRTAHIIGYDGGVLPAAYGHE